MNERYTNPTYEIADISGQSIAFQLGSLAELSERLAQNEAHTFIYEDDGDNLPHPIRNLSLETWPNSDGGPTIQAEVRCLAHDIISAQHDSNDTPKTTWEDELMPLLLGELRGEYANVTTFTHDARTIYAGVDPENYLEIRIDANLTECMVSISYGSNTEFTRATGTPLGAYSPDVLPPSQHLIYAATALKMTVDVLHELFQGPHGHKGAPHTLHLHQPAAPTAVGEASTPAPAIPEIEQQARPHQGLDTIGGATIAKQKLREIAAIAANPTRAAQYGLRGSHVILHGPHGTGKTSLARGFAEDIGATLQLVKSTDIVTKWIGKSSKNMADVFEEAKASEGRVVLFFDDFETLASNSIRDTERLATRKAFETALAELADHPNITVVAATSTDIADLDPALVGAGRLEQIAVPKPNLDERHSIWQTVLLNSKIKIMGDAQLAFDSEGKQIHTAFDPYADDIDCAELAQASSDLTGADFVAILEQARRHCFMTACAASTSDELTEVTHAALMHHIKHYNR